MTQQRLRAGRPLALLQVNLDRFRQVNDTLGFRAGDRLLADVAARLQLACASPVLRGEEGARREPVLARLGGDEFGLLLPEVDDAPMAEAMAGEVLRQFAEPFYLEGQDLYVTPSIGAAMHPGEASDDAALLRNAGAAMKHAKASGRNGVQFYVPGLNSASRERLRLETELRRALEREELVLHYQPKVDFASFRVRGAEALMRWQHPELGLVPPGRFIPIAEETGLIVEMGEWVADRACQQMAEWRDQHGVEMPVAVNVARHGLVSGDLQAVVSRALSRHGIGRGLLTLELTESMLMDRVETVAERLRALRELGVELSIDDFGTGYSEDRPLLRQGCSGLGHRRGDRARAGRARPQPEDAGRRRGRRDRRAAPAPAGSRLRLLPGLPLQPGAAAAGLHAPGGGLRRHDAASRGLNRRRGPGPPRVALSAGPPGPRGGSPSPAAPRCASRGSPRRARAASTAAPP